jgi:hypothetical protein
MSAHESIAQFSKMLKNLDQWLGKAEEHAKSKNFDPNILLKARLAPDQFVLVKQIQSACDAAKFAAVYLTGKEAPVFADTEATMTEIRDRIRKCREILDAVSESDFEGWAAKKVSAPWMGGKWVRGDHYMQQLAIPNFLFHVVTAYAILRHNGVSLGKLDYIGGLPMQD